MHIRTSAEIAMQTELVPIELQRACQSQPAFERADPAGVCALCALLALADSHTQSGEFLCIIGTSHAICL